MLDELQNTLLNTCSISKPMIRPGNIEQLLNCSFTILWSRTHLIKRHTGPLLQRQIDFPTNLTTSPPQKKKGANIQTLQVLHVLLLALIISNPNTSTFAALCAAIEISFR